MVNIDTIYLMHHTHTDLGYTNDQPIVWEIHNRILSDVLDIAEKYVNHNTDGKFRWTVETTTVLMNWLNHATSNEIERFIALERAGSIEVTAMYANLTPTFDVDQLVESFDIMQKMRRDYGFKINSAMNCDVNGAAWSLVDILLDLGVEHFSMAINPHSGGALKPRPHAFKWEGKSGRKLFAFNGWPYNKGWEMGVGRDHDLFENTWWPRAVEYLDKINYPLPIMLLQTFHPFGDNGPAFDYTAFIDEWNAQGKTPRIIMSTPSMWWNALKEYEDLMPTLRGDWTDWWSFGIASTAHHESLVRNCRARLQVADAIYGVIKPLHDGETRRWIDDSYKHYRDKAWDALHLWGEHTWGADDSVWRHDSDDTLVGWAHKAAYGFNARSYSFLLQRDAIAELARLIPTPDDPNELILFNLLPWEREVSGQIPPSIAKPRGLVEDGIASRQYLDRTRRHYWHAEDIRGEPSDTRLILSPTRVPPFGYVTIERKDMEVKKPITNIRDENIIENDYFRVTVDRDNGGIVSIFDKRKEWEWVDQRAEFRLNQVIHEEVADKTLETQREAYYKHEWRSEEVEIPACWRPNWEAKRTVACNVFEHSAFDTPIGVVINQKLALDGADGYLEQRITLPYHDDYIECESLWHMSLNVDPEAFYVAYPFNVPDARACYDVGGITVKPGQEQLPGVCRDYFFGQGWVNFTNDNLGVTVAIPENPLFQLGSFHFGHYQMEFKLERAMLLGWVTNNYWETNWRAHQPGLVTARYRIVPYHGAFDESLAHRIGLEAQHNTPLLQHLGEVNVKNDTFPRSGSLIQLPKAPIYVMHIKPSDDNGTLVRVINASDEAQRASFRSGILKIASATCCDLSGTAIEELNIVDDEIRLEVPARRFATVNLKLRRE